MASGALSFSEDGYFPSYEPQKTRHVHSVRGWCNYNDTTSTAEDAFDCWVGQRCPGSCCVGVNIHEDHTSHENLVVAVHGATRGDGSDGVDYMGVGVYFGEANSLNEGYYVRFLEDQPIQPASQRAEITAAVCALQKVCDIQTALLKHKIDRRKHAPVPGLRSPLLRVFVKTDSDYLMKSMNDWLQKRRETKYLTSGGKPITNKDVLEALDRWVCLLEKSNCQVVFWCVAIERNSPAEELANDALDRAA